MSKQTSSLGLSQLFYKHFCAMTGLVGLVGDFDLSFNREKGCVTYSFDLHVRPGTSARVSEEIQKFIDGVKKRHPEILGFSATAVPNKGVDDSFTTYGFLRNWFRSVRGLPKKRCDVFKIDLYVMSASASVRQQQRFDRAA